MPVDIFLPKLSMGMTEGTLAEWLVADGDLVDEGTPIYSLESDKSATEIGAPARGVLRIVGQADQVYEVGALIGRIE
jgi:pyruvate/2-oxoglutarate dehydrogenase complex dihydrolipoamide acyltransferase (E2) component